MQFKVVQLGRPLNIDLKAYKDKYPKGDAKRNTDDSKQV